MEIPWDELFPKTIPIRPIERGKSRQIPLRLAWGLTIHKYRELTLDSTTIKIGQIEPRGLTSTAISQVKALDFIWFQPPFSYANILKDGKVCRCV